MSFSNIDYAFAGYDIVKGYPLSKGRDPGFTSAIFKADYINGRANGDCRYSLPKGINAVPDVSCDVSFKSDIVKTKAEFHKYLAASANFQEGGWGFEFSASASYQKSTSDLSSREYVYIISKALCTSYFSRIEVSAPPPFDEGFLALARPLGNAQAASTEVATMVKKFVETYGTHFLDEVTFGSSYTQEHRTETSTFGTLSNEKFGVAVQASYSGLSSVGGGFSFDSEQQQAASNFAKKVETTTVTVGSAPPANGDALTWASVSKENPVPVKYNLRPIADLFTAKFFPSPSDIEYSTIRNRLLQAPLYSCYAKQANGAAVACVNSQNWGTEEVVTIQGGYAKLPASGETELFGGSYPGTGSQEVISCEPMCSFRTDCIGYAESNSSTCSIVKQKDEQTADHEWKNGASWEFTLYINRMKNDLVLKGKVPRVTARFNGVTTKLYSYYYFFNANEPRADNLKECRQICVHDPLCKAFRFGKCAGSGLCINRACYIFHFIESLTAETLTETEFHFVAK